MNDPIETAVEATSESLAIRLNSPVGLAVTFLAAYGAKTVTSDARRAVKQIRENRKAKKAAKVSEPNRSEQ